MVKEAKKMVNKKEKEFKLEDIFNFSIAGDAKPSMQKQKPYYTKVLKGEKRLAHRIVLMSPKDFLDHCFRVYDLNTPLKNPDVYKQPYKFALPWINILERKSVGQGRAFVCWKAKLKEIPILLVARLDKEIDSYLKGNKIQSKEYNAPTKL